jgi:hypothetical protein
MLANIGVPMVCMTVPTMLIALFPIAFVESLVLRRYLPISTKQAFWNVVSANLVSTFVGIPLTWLPLVAVQLMIGGGRAWGMETTQQRIEAVTLQAPWLIPYSDHLAWMIPVASLVLMVPFYFGSVFVEYLVLSGRWVEIDRRRLLRAVALANVVSYCGLAAYYVVNLALKLS